MAEVNAIWSAVTKAQAEHRFLWINKAYSVLLSLTLVVLFIEIVVAFILQFIVDFWLKNEAISVSIIYALCFSVSSWLFVVHNVNTSIGNGMSYFKVQMICMTIAAIIDIPFAWLLVKIFNGWIGVVVANVIALVPFEIMQPLYLRKHLSNLIEDI